MTPGSGPMLARAKISREKHGARLLDPTKASSLLMGDGKKSKVVDVRTAAQAAGHQINGKAGIRPQGAVSIPLDDLVSDEASVSAVLEGPGPTLLVCSKGPKSLVTLDYLIEIMGPDVELYALDGGITAWDNAGLPTNPVEE
eukprot:CAMPEP_0172614062 /NCGR_PEP_ID=MMETSP1068-20121228/49166_1 /TAXON_ID=35684 /ORGANISM="Pseudopedinella elastica, Strain CCMP716" /LENGTH=141 /DNA_ID=CAMNT_0013418731 /DNA_START=189 /DNA_END=614 /DNA_ORIENTATION=+